MSLLKSLPNRRTPPSRIWKSKNSQATYVSERIFLSKKRCQTCDISLCVIFAPKRNFKGGCPECGERLIEINVEDDELIAAAIMN